MDGNTKMTELETILKLPTPRLLAYYKKHYRDRSGRMRYNFECLSKITEAEYKEFNDRRELIAQELATREHIEK